MKKIRFITAIALIGALLTGCAEKNESTAEETTAAAAAITTVPSVTTAEVIEDPETETEAAEEEPFSLENCSMDEKQQIVKKLIQMKDGGGRNIFNPNASAVNFTVVSPDEFSVNAVFEYQLYREPTTLLHSDGNDYDSFYSAVDSAERSRYAKSFCNYETLQEGNVIVKIKVDENLNPEIVSITQEYTIENLTFNGFVRFNKDDTTTVIVDPAYMYGIPMPTYLKAYGHNINGIDTLMDSISFSSGSINHHNYPDYVYASMTVDSLTVSYDSIGNNYSSAPEITSFEVLYENGAEAISSAELLKKFDEKNDGSAAVYNTLTDNLDIFMGEDVVGVNLIDLDFDGTPEVLVTKTVQDEVDEGIDECADVDIYTIADGKMNYVDTLYNHKRLVYQSGNVIGIKTTDKLEKKWYTMSRKNIEIGITDDVDYLFTLENGKLNYTEVFRSEITGYKPESDAADAWDYYFYGEKLEINSYEGPHLYEGDEPWIYCEWNGIEAAFGTWELWGFIRAEYCKDIDIAFNLYSDWLVKYNEYEACEKIILNERTMEYKLAYLVDAFYYGYYDEEEQNYNYWFLGDYAKPVIYLYHEEETEVSVKVELEDGELTCTYPDYRDGWNVTAYPDGTIIDNADGNEYYCLYWEGVGKSEWDMSKGFVVKSEDTADFLREKLAEIGLTPRESNEFIIYWLPELQKNDCNFITFQTEQYEKNAVLDIDPVPDSVLRVFMVYNECDPDTVIESQEFETFERNGFTVVEWGGSHAE